jgi:RNA polymerase sigma factor (sigma-70 family)
LLASVQAYLDDRASRHEPDRRGADAWDRFFAAADPLIRRIARRRSNNRADFEDRVQEAWAAVLSRFPRISGRAHHDNLAGLLAVIARRAIADHDRSPAHRPLPGLDAADAAELFGRESSPPRVAEREETRRDVRAKLEELRRRGLEAGSRVIHLRWIEGKGIEEIAAILGCPAKMVRDRQRRGLLKLQSLFRDPIGPSRRGDGRVN